VCLVVFLQQGAEEILLETNRSSPSLREVKSEPVELVERRRAMLPDRAFQHSERSGRRKTQPWNIHTHFNETSQLYNSSLPYSEIVWDYRSVRGVTIHRTILAATRDFSHLQNSQTSSGVHPLSYSMATRDSFPGVNLPGYEGDHASSSVKVKHK
jgi:hypothetical protein